MPLYEYACDQCDHRFEVIQKFSDAPIATCPKCGGPVQKLLSSPAIQFKGSGFYLTDYGRGTGSKSDGGSKPAKSDATSTPSASTDSASSSTETKTPAPKAAATTTSTD